MESEDASKGERIHAHLAGETVELTESEATTAGFLKERGEEQIERIFEGQEYQQLREKRLWLNLGWQAGIKRSVRRGELYRHPRAGSRL